MNGLDSFLNSRTLEEKLLARQALDKADAAMRSYRVTATKFLTPAEGAFLKSFCQRAHLRVCFDGGREGAERVLALFLPDWMEDGLTGEQLEEESPITVLKVTNTGGIELSHRDYLGALMSEGIRRDVIGDIEVHGAEAYVFCVKDMAEYLSSNLKSAGRARLNVSTVNRAEVPVLSEDDGEELYGTVQSLRLDAVVAEGFNLSREDAKTLITQGACSIDHVLTEKPDTQVFEGCLISVRGRGRLKFARVRGETRRGRIGIELVRYGSKRR